MLRSLGTAFAAGLMLATGSAIWADDTVRLGGPSAENSIRGGTDTELVYARRGGFYGGRGYGGGGFYGGRGYYGGYGRGFYGGGFYGGYGRGFYGVGYGRGFYGGGYYGGYGRGYYGASYSVGYYAQPYYGGYYSSYYYPAYSYPSYYYYPCAGEVAPTMTLQAEYAPSQLLPAPRENGSYMPPAGANPGNYQYDGGPNQQVPMPYPGTDVNPAKVPAPGSIIPLDGKLVSLPTEVSGGFSPVTLTLPQQQRASVIPGVPRVNYPAYGEQR